MTTPQAIKTLRQSLTSMRARARSAMAGKPLAPGRLVVLTSGQLADQSYMLRRAAEDGPIFKLIWGGKVTTCIVGNERCNRFLRENDDRLNTAATDMTPLFPIGFLRALEGEQHRQYRRILQDVFRAVSVADRDAEIRAVLGACLGALAARGTPLAGDELRPALRRAAMAVLAGILLGVPANSPEFETLAGHYQAYAPKHPFVSVKEHSRRAFAEIRAVVLELARKPPLDGKPSILSTLVARNALDDTTLGNVVQMMDAGSYDVHSLWHWMIRMLAPHPGALAKVAGASGEERSALAGHVVHETLRLEQIELLNRYATADIVFEGFLIPKNTRIRLCLWEGHKDEKTFRCPFDFKPERFQEKRYPIDAFAPFGMGKHRCLGADLSHDISVMFVEALAEYELEVGKDAPSVRGVFHFEPNPEFSVKLKPRVMAEGEVLQRSIG